MTVIKELFYWRIGSFNQEIRCLINFLLLNIVLKLHRLSIIFQSHLTVESCAISKHLELA